ncbi:MAG TPA: PA2169 family four-helix-bundle protein [Sphingomicrobium sp.]|nr:PA2169 family four-helix-bundle protein [Sphingomicrobium sp.]
MANDEQKSILETLTTTLIDSVNGFNEAAENTDTPHFEQLFRQHEQERRQAVETLQSEIRRLGGEPPSDGSMMGKTHQTWLDLKAAITGRDDERIIKSVESGEDYLKEKFETALSSGDLTGESRQAVERAYQSVRSGHDRMSALKHQVEAEG